MKIMGLDISINHGGAILLDGRGNFLECDYFTNIAGAAKLAPNPEASRLRVMDKKKDEIQQFQMWRLCWVRTWLENLLDRWRPTHVGIEDYALRQENGAHQMGQIGGISRMLCWDRGVYFRLHDPISVKMYATYDGTAQKDLVEREVARKWKLDFSKYNPPVKIKGKNQNRCTSEDLADSAAIAKLVWMEIQLRTGHISPTVLHEKELRVFNRVTNTYPTSLLGREWIHNPDGSYNSALDVLERVREKARYLAKMSPGTAIEQFVRKLLEG